MRYLGFMLNTSWEEEKHLSQKGPMTRAESLILISITTRNVWHWWRNKRKKTFLLHRKCLEVTRRQHKYQRMFGHLAFKGWNNLQQHNNDNTDISYVLITDFFSRVDIFGCLFRDPARCLFLLKETLTESEDWTCSTPPTIILPLISALHAAILLASAAPTLRQIHHSARHLQCVVMSLYFHINCFLSQRTSTAELSRWRQNENEH